MPAESPRPDSRRLRLAIFCQFLALCLGLSLAATRVAAAESPAIEMETPIAIPNGGFEDGPQGWTFGPEGGMGEISTAQAAAGQHSLKVTDRDGKKGSDISSERLSIPGRGVYILHGQYFAVSGGGLGMYIKFFDAQGQALPPDYSTGLQGSDPGWQDFSLTAYGPENAATLQLWLHSYDSAKVEGYVDNLSLGYKKTIAPPWAGQYKLKPEETARLTPADVVGPDGIVYPNWKRTGVRGDIPQVETKATIEQFGGRADDEIDDSAALDAASRSVGEAGGGAVQLSAGTYYLDQPVTIRHSGVVIRGVGADQTKVIFRYRIPDPGAVFFGLKAGDTLGAKTRLLLHCRPQGVEKMRIELGGVVLRDWVRSLHSGNTFECAANPDKALEKLADGEYELKGVGEYADGHKNETALRVRLQKDWVDEKPLPATNSAITFLGQGWDGEKIKLTQDGRRGDLQLEIADASTFKPGDCVYIEGPATERWKKLTTNACRWGIYRTYATVVEKVEGNRLHLEQPLRIDFPLIDESFVRKLAPIYRCGVEDLYLEQTEDLWITTVTFYQAWDCWAKGVRVRKCGRNPVYGSFAKWCTIRDCVFDDAWFKGGGGTAYAGWEKCWDSLTEHLETFKFRHAPLYQWSASGNVIRQSVFHDSDAQWHSGWTNENLFEECVIESVTGNGGYGFGMWASPPEDAAHGPNGPRNVIYNCSVTSPKDGLWMGGMNENWLVLYNRFAVQQGCGITAKTASFDHLIKGNVFVLENSKEPLLKLLSPDCLGVELTDNVLYGGNGQLCMGMTQPALVERNDIRPLDKNAPRPTPAVASIYEWQQRAK